MSDWHTTSEPLTDPNTIVAVNPEHVTTMRIELYRSGQHPGTTWEIRAGGHWDHCLARGNQRTRRRSRRAAEQAVFNIKFGRPVGAPAAT